MKRRGCRTGRREPGPPTQLDGEAEAPLLGIAAVSGSRALAPWGEIPLIGAEFAQCAQRGLALRLGELREWSAITLDVFATYIRAHIDPLPTSPNSAVTTAFWKFPLSGSPVRENAMAPA